MGERGFANPEAEVGEGRGRGSGVNTFGGGEMVRRCERRWVWGVREVSIICKGRRVVSEGVSWRRKGEGGPLQHQRPACSSMVYSVGNALLSG